MSSMRFRVKRGLDVPVRGAPEQAIDEGKRVESVVIRLSGDDEESFDSRAAGELAGLDRDKVRDNPTDSLT